MSDHTPSQQQRNGEHVLYCFNDDAITYGSRVNAADLKFDIVLEADKVVRLINPSSDPRLSWQRIRNHCHVDWGDGHVTKWYARVINSGRFNRDSEFIPQHEYKNANVGDRFTITVKCREPLVPIYCRLDKIWGEFPEDIYRVKSSRDSNDDVGLFGECYHVDYPELSLLNKHRDTVHTLGADLLVNWRNTDMTNMFSHFIALREVPVGFFKTVMGNVLSYEKCFFACDSLEKVDPGLLGLGNNTVRVLDSMFEGCLSLKNTIYLQNSESLVSVKSMYKDCHKINLCDERLFNYCPNIAHADRIFMNDRMLGTLGPKVLKFSLNMETISEACKNTGMTQTYISIGKMNKLYNAREMYYGCDKLATITDGFFQNTGINASQEVDFDKIFMRAGDRTNGCVVPSKLCQPVGNITRLKPVNSKWFFNFWWRGGDFPADLFRDTFKSGPNRKMFAANDMLTCGVFPEVHEIEIRNKILTGNQSNLIKIARLFDSVGETLDVGEDESNTSVVNDKKPITYFNRDMFSEAINLESVFRVFARIRIDFKFYEDIFKNNKKIIDFISLFRGAIYKFNKFPIDYIVRTTSNDSDIDMSRMYEYSNIKVYRPIHWSATKDVRYKMNDIVKANIVGVSVPVEFMLDGRTQVDSNYEHEYEPRGIVYVYQANSLNNNIVTLKLESGTYSNGKPMETHLTPADIDWGDGSRETWRPTTTSDTLSHRYSGAACYKIVIKSERTPYFIKQLPVLGTEDKTYPILEVRGEFPYACFDGYSSLDGMTCFMVYYHLDQSVYRIVHADGSMFKGALYQGVKTYHPYLLKYDNNHNIPGRIFEPYSLSAPIWGSKALDNDIDDPIIYPRFYENCVSADKLSYTLNVNTKMIPDDIFPKNLLHSENVDMKYMGGLHAGYQDTKYKFHIKPSLYRDWMIRSLDDLSQSELYLSYPVLPYNTGWINKLPYQSPLYEKLTFVVRDITIDNVGLERLAAGNIGEIRIEIFTDSGIIDKKINIVNEADLNGCIGNLTGELNVINIYSKIPLWLDNHNIINEVRGVIPECNLNKTFKTLAPNVTRISDTLFYRLTNKSFNEMFKDCTKLEQIPPHLFLCNIKAESFISCFENCTSLDRIPDYFLVCYDHDIDCTYMFKGCTNIKHIYRPISDSVLGRVKATDMFLGCQTTAFELSKNMNEQALDGVWYTGDAKLVKADIPANWQRATTEIPTLFTGYHYDNYNPTNGISKITDNDIAKASASVYVADPINTFSKSTVIPKPRELGKAFGYRFSHIHFTHLSCISMSDLCELTRYAINMQSLQSAVNGDLFYPHQNAMFKDEKLIISKDFMFWNENLHDLWSVFEGSTVYAPFHSSFLKMNDRISKLSRLFYGAHIRHVDDIDVGGVLGKNVLNDLYLGAKARTHELNLNVLLDRNIELMCNFSNTFNAVKGNFNGDSLHLGTCEPYNVEWMFANVKSLEDGNYRVDPDAGYPFTNYTLENVLNNPNLGRHGDYSEFTLSDFGFAAYNDKITSDTGLLKKLTSFKHRYYNDVWSRNNNDKELVQAIYLFTNLTEIPNDCFENMDPSVPVMLRDIFAGTKIKSLPRINHLVNLCDTWHLFGLCTNLTNPIIPENYIKSDYQGGEVSLLGMFGGSSVRVENQFIDITSTATFNVKASLENCISTIGDDPEIFKGIKYNTNPANHSRVNATGKVKNAFHQIIQTKKAMTPVHIEYVGDHTTSIKNVNDMEISWGDGSINEVYNGEVDFATLRHTYNEPGEYEIQIRCNEFTTYVETSSEDYEDKITKFVGKFMVGDVTNGLFDIPLYHRFGNYVEEFENGLFDNLSNPENISKINDLFRDQVRMSKIPNEVFKPFINLEQVLSTFEGCIGLSSIPVDIFKYNVKLREMITTFKNCSLQTIPKDLFISNTNIESLSETFYSNKLRSEGIPMELLKPLSRLNSINDPFGGNQDIIIENDERWNNLFKYNSSLIEINGIASSAHLKSIPINILNINGNNSLNSIRSLFEFKGSTDITTTDPNITVNNSLFTNIVTKSAVSDVSRLFKNRKNIKKFNVDLFKSLVNLTSLSESFMNTGISEIPKYVIDVVHTSTNIDCSGMFANCKDVYSMENEPINQNATRIVNTKDMLLNVRSLYCEPEIFYGVHPKDGEFNSGYIWNTNPISQTISFNHESPNGYYVDDFRLFPFYEWQKTEFEPIYIEKIEMSATRSKNVIATKEIIFKKTFRSLDELLNGTVVNAKHIVENEFQATRANDYISINIYTNKPLRLQYIDPTKKNSSYFWNGASGFITRTKHNSYDQSKWSFNNMTKNDEDTLFDLDEGVIFSNGYTDLVTDYNVAGFKYLQNKHHYLYADLSFKNMINIDYYLANTSYWNVAIRGENDLGEMEDRYPAYLPRFDNMPNVKYANKVFFNTFFVNYGEDLSNYRDHPSIVKWEPFINNHNIEQFGHLYYNTNIPKLFKLNFDTPNGVSSITHMFAKTTQHYDIPFDYFNGITKLKATTITDDTGTYEDAFFMDWIFGRGSKQTTLRDKSNGKMLMSEWRPDFDEGIDLYISGLFDGSLIPNEERLEFIDKLPLIHEYSHKRFREVHFDWVELINADYSGDITPFLRNGKFLDLSNINCEYLTLENLLLSVTKADKTATLTNIPKGAVVLPDKATIINLNNMFKGCVAAPDVTDISQCFVYNGTADVPYQSSGLQLAPREKKVRFLFELDDELKDKASQNSSDVTDNNQWPLAQLLIQKRSNELNPENLEENITLRFIDGNPCECETNNAFPTNSILDISIMISENYMGIPVRLTSLDQVEVDNSNSEIVRCTIGSAKDEVTNLFFISIDTWYGDPVGNCGTFGVQPIFDYNRSSRLYNISNISVYQLKPGGDRRNKDDYEFHHDVPLAKTEFTEDELSSIRIDVTCDFTPGARTDYYRYISITSKSDINILDPWLFTTYYSEHNITLDKSRATYSLEYEQTLIDFELPRLDIPGDRLVLSTFHGEGHGPNQKEFMPSSEKPGALKYGLIQIPAGPKFYINNTDKYIPYELLYTYVNFNWLPYLLSQGPGSTIVGASHPSQLMYDYLPFKNKRTMLVADFMGTQFNLRGKNNPSILTFDKYPIRSLATAFKECRFYFLVQNLNDDIIANCDKMFSSLHNIKYLNYTFTNSDFMNVKEGFLPKINWDNTNGVHGVIGMFGEYSFYFDDRGMYDNGSICLPGVINELNKITKLGSPFMLEDMFRYQIMIGDHADERGSFSRVTEIFNNHIDHPDDISVRVNKYFPNGEMFVVKPNPPEGSTYRERHIDVSMDSIISTEERALAFNNLFFNHEGETIKDLDYSKFGLIQTSDKNNPVDISNVMSILKTYGYNSLIEIKSNVTGELNLEDMCSGSICSSFKNLIDKKTDMIAINIPRGAVVLPDNCTSITLTDMFKGCMAADDVDDIAECFVYNGPLKLNYYSSKLEIAKGELIIEFSSPIPDNSDSYLNLRLDPTYFNETIFGYIHINDSDEHVRPYIDFNREGLAKISLSSGMYKWRAYIRKTTVPIPFETEIKCNGFRLIFTGFNSENRVINTKNPVILRYDILIDSTGGSGTGGGTVTPTPKPDPEP